MASKAISAGTVHKLTSDIQKVLASDKKLLTVWESLTPLARNEWICWVTFVKQDKTRKEHVERLVEDLKSGKRRPCCWIGCIHRKDKAVSPSVKWALSKKSKKKS